MISGFGSAAEAEQCVAWMAHEIPAAFWASLKAGGHVHPDVVLEF